MYVIVDERDLVLEGYRKSFRREGVASVGFRPRDFRGWLETSPKDDLAAVEGVLLGMFEGCADLPEVIRRYMNIPVIALSEMNSLDEVLELFSVGVDDVVRKPVHVREILARANAIMRRLRADSDADAVTVGDIRIFPDGRPPLVAGEPLPLPRREYRILEHLAMNAGRRITKQQLFNTVYGLFEDQVEESVIESHISKLRKKLRQRLGYDPIDSRRFLGYCLHAAAPQGAHAAQAGSRRESGRQGGDAAALRAIAGRMRRTA